MSRLNPLIALILLTLMLSCTNDLTETASISEPTAMPPTATIVATETAAATRTSVLTVAPSSTPLPTLTATALPGPTAFPTETIVPTDAAKPTATIVPTETIVPTNTPVPTSTPVPVPTGDLSLWLMGFEESADSNQWLIVNDTVMGGVSTAGGFVKDSVLTFNGELSLANNGGFTSIRHNFTTDLTGYAGIRMRVRGDGRSYYLRLTDNSTGRETSHERLFATQANEWTTVVVRFDELIANFRGFAIDHPPLDPAKLRGMGIMLREKNEGWFQLEIDWIQAFK